MKKHRRLMQSLHDIYRGQFTVQRWYVKFANRGYRTYLKVTNRYVMKQQP